MWHIQRNIVKKFSGLSKKDKDLYNKVVALPFISRKTKFETYVKELTKSKALSTDEKRYLEDLLSRKDKWAKHVIKSQFGGGVSTTSRVEGLHSVLRKYLTSKSSIQNVFYCFREIEDSQIEKFNNEFYTIKDVKSAETLIFLQKIKEVYPEYTVKKMVSKYFKSLDYTQTIEKSNKKNEMKW